jgi:apolipoprotein D and lipocalin family protein
MRIIPLLVGLLVVSVTSITCVSPGKEPQSALQVVSHVDIKRYAGTWYEIARYPNRFQKGCVAATAQYALRDDGKIDVLNQCREHTPDGKLLSAKGTAKVVDATTNAKLKVTFFWPFSGQYWIIDLGENYEYAVVGHPDRKYLWILSRTPEMEEELYTQILGRITQQGYDVSKLIKTPQVKPES